MFFSDKFTFNGIHCDEKYVSLITMESDIINKFGLDFQENLEVSKGKRSNSMFSKGENEPQEVVLQIALHDEKYIPLAWEDDVLIDIMDWIVQDNFCPFVSEDNEDLTYYFKATNITKHFTYDKLGYLEVTFQSFSDYAYKQLSRKINVNGETSITIVNETNVENFIFPIVEVSNLGDELNIIAIDNISVDKEEFIMYNLEEDEKVVVDNLMGTITNQYNENCIMKCNRKWLQLKKGKNILNISGKANIIIKCQIPIRM